MPLSYIKRRSRQREQVIHPNEPKDPFRVREKPTVAQFGRYAPMPVPQPVLDYGSLNRRSQLHLLQVALSLLKRRVEAGSAHWGPTAHPFNT
jgi:hypothetical protein